MEQTTISPQNKDDEVTLKELILKIQGWFLYLLRKWKILLLVCLIGAGLGLTMSFYKRVQYLGEVTFILEENNTGGMLGAYSGIANQFGIDLGGASSGSSSTIYTTDNIIEFLKSRLMIEKTLLSPVIIDDKKVTLAEVYMEVYELRNKWKGKNRLKDIHFPPDLQHNKFSLLQDSVLNIMHESILKRNLNVDKLNKKLSFILVQFKSPNELFSKIFAERLVKEATDFYVQTKTKRSKTNVDKLQEKADSIEQLLYRKSYSVAKAQDLNLNPARSVAGVELEMGARDKMVLQTMWAEVVKNLEISKMAMLQETPVIQTIDTPILPLKKERLGKLKGLVIGGFLGGLLGAFVLLTARIYREIMQ